MDGPSVGSPRQLALSLGPTQKCVTLSTFSSYFDFERHLCPLIPLGGSSSHALLPTRTSTRKVPRFTPPTAPGGRRKLHHGGGDLPTRPQRLACPCDAASQICRLSPCPMVQPFQTHLRLTQSPLGKGPRSAYVRHRFHPLGRTPPSLLVRHGGSTTRCREWVAASTYPLRQQEQLLECK